MVDGVLASAHSDWLLDEVTPAWATHLLPHAYQVRRVGGETSGQHLSVEPSGSHGASPAACTRQCHASTASTVLRRQPVLLLS